jgi:hypothetical protein
MSMMIPPPPLTAEQRKTRQFAEAATRLRKRGLSRNSYPTGLAWIEAIQHEATR